MSEENKQYLIKLSLDRPIILLNAVKLRLEGYNKIELPPKCRAYLTGITSQPIKLEEGTYELPENVKLIVAYLEEEFTITIQFSTLAKKEEKVKLSMKVYDPSLIARWWLSNEEELNVLEMDIFNVLEHLSIPLLSGKKEADKFAIIDFFRGLGIGVHGVEWVHETTTIDPLAVVKSAAEKLKEKLGEIERETKLEMKKEEKESAILHSIPPPPPFADEYSPLEHEIKVRKEKQPTTATPAAEEIKPETLPAQKKEQKTRPIHKETEEIKTIEEVSEIPVITPETDEKEKPIHRHIEVNYYKIMRIHKTYPIRTRISTSRLEEKTKKPFFVENVEEIVEFEPDTDLVELRLVMPGCLVNPSTITVDIREELTDNLFYVTPLSAGSFTGVLEIWKAGKRAAIIDVPFKSVSLSPAKISAISGLFTALPIILKPFGIDLETKINKALYNAFLLTKPLAGVITGILTAILFIGAGAYYFVYSKEKEAYKDAFMT